MDPQKLSQLDPKLRDAYQRVMGTPIPQVQTQPIRQAQGEPVQTQTPTPTLPTPDPILTPTPMPEPEPTPPPPPSEPTPAIQEPPVAPVEPPAAPPIPEPQPSIPQQPLNQASNFVQMNSEVASAPQNFTNPGAVPQPQTIALKKKNGMMMPILFGVVGVIFIVVYTLFWTKIFNFKLPFLP